MKHFLLSEINSNGCQTATLTADPTQMNTLYAWHLTPNSTSPHTILHLKRQHLTVSWSDGKFHLDTCVPDVCSYTCTLLFCLQYLPQTTFPIWLNWEVEPSESTTSLKHFFSLLFYLVIHMFSVSLLTLFLHNSFYSKSTSHLFCPCLKNIENWGFIAAF